MGGTKGASVAMTTAESPTPAKPRTIPAAKTVAMASQAMAGGRARMSAMGALVPFAKGARQGQRNVG